MEINKQKKLLFSFPNYIIKNNFDKIIANILKDSAIILYNKKKPTAHTQIGSRKTILYQTIQTIISASKKYKLRSNTIELEFVIQMENKVHHNIFNNNQRSHNQEKCKVEVYIIRGA